MTAIKLIIFSVIMPSLNEQRIFRLLAPNFPGNTELYTRLRKRIDRFDALINFDHLDDFLVIDGVLLSILLSCQLELYYCV